MRPDEDVRSINGDAADCRPENLEMWCGGKCLGQPARWLEDYAQWVLAMRGLPIQ